MRRISCETCTVRVQGAICNVPAHAQADFRAVAQTALYKAQQVVFAEGNPCAGMYLVCHGSVKLFHSDRFGRDHILEVVGPGTVLGEFALDQTQVLSISAATLTETQLSFLPLERLLRFLQQYPATGIRLLEALSRDLARARRKVRDLALKGAEGRLATLLLQLAGAGVDTMPAPAERRVQIAYRRRELAEMIGVSTETAIRLLGKLRDKQLIRIHRREIALLDVPRLTRVANHDEAEG